uniref:SERTA domain containing 4 n=1 Tax=Fundulus heteroclitus TaxID=8078 RepID=A0A3Q2TA79_FUNHE
MTLVLSVNPFLDSEGDAPLSAYPPLWDPPRCRKAGRSDPDLRRRSAERQTREAPPPPPPPGRVPDQVSMSRIAYFKRKFVDDDEEPPFSFRTYCQTVAPVLEERAHVLRLSLEKMRFIDDPELFLRRSVLVNNLLRRLRAEILLQSADWCFPPNPPLAAPCVLPPSAASAHQALHRAPPARICLPPPAGPPLRKRFRVVGAGRGGFGPDCGQTCCCLYAAAAAGRYLHLPLSVYDAALSSCPSTASTSLLQLAGHSRLGLTVAVADEEEEEEEEEEEPREEGAPAAAQDESDPESRTRTSGHRDRRTEDSCMAESAEEEGEQEEEEEEEEEEEQVVGPCSWDSGRDLHRRHRTCRQ